MTIYYQLSLNCLHEILMMPPRAQSKWGHPSQMCLWYTDTVIRRRTWVFDKILLFVLRSMGLHNFQHLLWLSAYIYDDTKYLEITFKLHVYHKIPNWWGENNLWLTWDGDYQDRRLIKFNKIMWFSEQTLSKRVGWWIHNDTHTPARKFLGIDIKEVSHRHNHTFYVCLYIF